VVISGTVPAPRYRRSIGPKEYDRAYFDRWYRRGGFGARSRIERKLTYAVGAAEYLLDRRIGSVLDIGCGEGQWATVLRRMRPGVRYTGIDPSPYVVERYGRARGLVLGGVADLPDLTSTLGGPFDLVVCCDVLPYVDRRDLTVGLPALEVLVGGVAFLEVWTSGDELEGDLEGFRRRSPAVYERWFSRAGLTRVGPHLYVPRSVLTVLAALERPR
jgi:SAM-dependent methyltransferase